MLCNLQLTSIFLCCSLYSLCSLCSQEFKDIISINTLEDMGMFDDDNRPRYHLLNAEPMAQLSVSEETYQAACQKMIRVYDAASDGDEHTMLVTNCALHPEHLVEAMLEVEQLKRALADTKKELHSTTEHLQSLIVRTILDSEIDSTSPARFSQYREILSLSGDDINESSTHDELTGSAQKLERMMVLHCTAHHCIAHHCTAITAQPRFHRRTRLISRCPYRVGRTVFGQKTQVAG